jgi:GT2 family glycosyltransferase
MTPSAQPLSHGLTLVVPTYKRADSLERLLGSVVIQDRQPDEILIVDASPNDETEKMLETQPSGKALRNKLRYWRVSGPLVGLTRQKNFALRQVKTDLVAFFDDDIVLGHGCLREMEQVLRRETDRIVAVGCLTAAETPPSALWRLRRFLRMIPNLRPGTYARSGMSIPWQFQPSPQPLVEGDWLPGGAQLVRTAAAHEVGFDESFSGYGQAEDLDFSLRLRTKGKLVMARAARLQHLSESGGRPNPFRIGYMELYNRYQIHRRTMRNHRWQDAAWFTYAWTLDTLLLARHLRSPGDWGAMLQQIAGRAVAAGNIVKDETVRRQHS